jgi:hypothetical protein
MIGWTSSPADSKPAMSPLQTSDRVLLDKLPQVVIETLSQPGNGLNGSITKSS